MTATLLDKLKLVREKDDIELPDTPNFRDTYINRSGEEKPLELRGYQKQMVVHLMALKRFVVGDDTGLGKTIEAIAALCQLWKKDPTLKAVVLTKKSSMTPGWDLEGFEAFTTGVKVLLAKGGPKQREKCHQEWLDHDGPVVLIQSYGSACNDIRRLQHWSDYVLICDEATVFKNPKTRVHKVCRYLSSRAARVWGLTATLIKNNLMEGYGVYRVIVPDLFRITAQAFMGHYCIVRLQRVAKGRQVPVIVGYSDEDIDKFREKIDLYYLGRPKHLVATELPVLTSKDVICGLTKWQREKYAEAEAGLMEHGDGEDRETTQLTALIYCQEIVNHPGLIDFPAYKSEKLDALTDLLTTGDLEGEKVIVYTRFSRMVDIAIAHLTKKGVKCTRVTGAETTDQRRAAMLTFQNVKSDTSVIFITMAGGDAINLQAAKALIFFDTPWSAGDYLQILGRMIRIGSDHDRVFAIHLICRETIDVHVQAVKNKKMGLITKVLGERIKGQKGKSIIYQAGSAMRDVFDLMTASSRKKRLPKAKPKNSTKAPAKPKKKRKTKPKAVPTPVAASGPKKRRKFTDEELGL